MELTTTVSPGFNEVLTTEALQFIEKLEREFHARRLDLLRARVLRQEELDAGGVPDFLPATRHIRAGEWQVAPIPADLQNRRVEITGPTDRKMVINALNSGANVFMADFEDANSPTWNNMIEGHINLRDALERAIDFTSPDGKRYSLNERVAVLMVRPRGWHLTEKHALVDGKPISASLFDFGLYFFHNARRVLEKGSGPYFYLPKLESHLEARLWNDVFNFAQDALSLPRGTIKVTVLIETILAAFEMEEILYELRDHIAGLNAGRWDYIFSIIKKFHNNPNIILPDRSQITMTVPFMRAYTELLVKTCHARGAHAIGGMAAFIPSRKDLQVNETALAKVRADKQRESTDGFDGTWVAHPDLVPVAAQAFDQVLQDKPHQKEILREDLQVEAGNLLDFKIENASVTEAGARLNINVALQYLDAWLRGSGAVGIYNLMEDAATAEISRAQIWQWIHHHAPLADGRKMTAELYRGFLEEEMGKIRSQYGEQAYPSSRIEEAKQLFDRLTLDTSFAEFLTLPAYDYLD
ncbi:MAG TPA: malate synthase A [Anaerolineales bacterium]|jgi:malate synthase|nr:malate synthase A [Anaerolineales bacterium]HQX15086.1 malate synthase A [Anaerolineales bacterium]